LTAHIGPAEERKRISAELKTQLIIQETLLDKQRHWFPELTRCLRHLCVRVLPNGWRHQIKI
jgi:hypothetical protein